MSAAAAAAVSPTNTAKSSTRNSHKKISPAIHRRHNCDYCGANFETGRELGKHNCYEINIDDQKPTSSSTNCNVCQTSFSTQRQLRAHVRQTHTNSHDQITVRQRRKSTTISIEDRKSSSAKRKSHKKSGAKKRFECPDCQKSYSFAHGLRAHQLTHTGEKPHACDECGKTFSQRSFLQIHTRTHTGEKPYECLKCGKKFRQPSHLRYHAVSHSKSTARGHFVCTVCGKRLRYQQSLRLHLRTAHAGVAGRPHKCEHCDKTFAEKPKLRLHVRVHTGERPYECDLCGRLFAQKGNRDKHKARYHARDSDRKFRCDRCPKAFIWKKCLDMHHKWHKMASDESKKAEAEIWRTDVDKASNVEIEATSSSSSSTSIINKKEESDVEMGDIVVDDEVGDGDRDTNGGDDRSAAVLLESSVSKLIPHLLDEEVLTEIGWPTVGIDQVVIKVLRWCDQSPAEDSSESPLSLFERNVRTLLDIVLEEKFDEVAGLRGKSPHAIVEQLLKTIDNGA